MRAKTWLTFSCLLPLLAARAFAAAPSPDGELLAYSFIGEPESIYLSRFDGTAARALVARETREFRPEWFPDGKSLVFTSAVDGGPQLFRVDVDGGGLTALTPVELKASDGHPSPDGARVVFFRDADDGFDLSVLELATGRVSQLTDTPSFREYAPRWSPDGTKILFVGSPDPETPSDIWILDLASGSRRNVTRTPFEGEFHPAWSSDGRRIAFIRFLEGEHGLQDSEYAVWVVDLQSGEGMKVASEPGIPCFSPHFTPDDRWVTFTRNLFEGSREGLPGVFRVRPDGRDLQRLGGVPGSAPAGDASTQAPRSQELHPSWNPAGSQITFQSDRFGSPDVFVLDLGSGEARRLTDSPADDASPVWSRDGEWICFHSNREGNYDLYLIRPDGSGLLRLTDSGLDEANAAWSPSSTELVHEVRIDRHWYLGIFSLSDRSGRTLLDRPGDHLTPTWFPTGQIAFTYSPPGGNHDTDVVLMRVDERGEVLGELLAGAKGNSNVHYSAARDRLVFNSIRDGNWEIYSAGLHGEGTRRLTVQAQPDLAGIDGQPEWDPKGDRIAITSGRAGSLDVVLLDEDGTELRNLTESWRSENVPRPATAQPAPEDE